MFLVVLVVLGVFGATVWVVLDRPVAARVDESQRMSALCLTLSAVAITAGLAYGLGALL